MKQTCLEKYGSSSPLNNLAIRDRIKETLINKYGVDNSFKADKVKNKIKLTLMNNYGVSSFSKTEKYKKSTRDRVYKLQHIRLNRILENKGYTINDRYEGKYNINEKGNYCSYKKYSITHKLCNNRYGTYFNGDVFIKCPKCFPYQSNKELELRGYIEFLLPNEVVLYNNRSIIHKELDVYLPNLGIALEYNGTYWHSTIHSRIHKNYHKNKTEACLKRGIKLYHIWEHYNIEIVKRILREKLNIPRMSFEASTLKVKLVKPKERQEFYKANNLYGDVPCTFSVGLYKDKELIQCISFKTNKEDTELIRFCTKANCEVHEGFKKLLQYRINRINKSKVSEITVYVDVDLEPNYEDSTYYKEGFKYKGNLEPQLMCFSKNLCKVNYKEYNQTYNIYNSGKHILYFKV